MTAAILNTAAPTNTLLLNVAIIPPEDISVAAVKLSRQAKAIGGSFQIDGVSRFAHMTLYMARFNSSEMSSVRHALLTLQPSLQAQNIQHSGYYVTAGSYYEISYARTSSLLALHEMIAKSLREFRYSPGNPVTESYFGSYSDEQRLNAKVWGYDLAGDLYRPHVTLTRFTVVPQKENIPKTQRDLSFTATKIGLFEADHMGAARRLIMPLNLTSNSA